MKIHIDAAGKATLIYTDDLKKTGLQIESIKRASHVEPDDKGNWIADMGPSNGPILGPFPTREQALAEEVKWLEKNVLGSK
jgi:hypothetical protein